MTDSCVDSGGRDRRMWVSGKDGAFYWESSVEGTVCKDGYEEAARSKLYRGFRIKNFKLYHQGKLLNSVK